MKLTGLQPGPAAAHEGDAAGHGTWRPARAEMRLACWASATNSERASQCIELHIALSAVPFRTADTRHRTQSATVSTKCSFFGIQGPTGPLCRKSNASMGPLVMIAFPPRTALFAPAASACHHVRDLIRSGTAPPVRLPPRTIYQPPQTCAPSL